MSDPYVGQSDFSQLLQQAMSHRYAAQAIRPAIPDFHGIPRSRIVSFGS